MSILSELARPGPPRISSACVKCERAVTALVFSPLNRVIAQQLQTRERKLTMKLSLLTVFVITIASLCIIPVYRCSSSSQSQFQWQILTKQNFSSQIRLHNHLLLLVALPCTSLYSSNSSFDQHNYVLRCALLLLTCLMN